ncbi:helix-hairpin-helix domain-containing protein [Natronomonas sp.]|uniref:helix-hairpin-helix domain-containing protein n=1 Tax=Natronomonas sp. TaxID=2184060 RepID=UPI0039759E96
MPDLSVSDAQLERLEEIAVELEAVYVGDYGSVRPADALEYLLDTYTSPDADANDEANADTSDAAIESLTAIDGVGEVTATALVSAGFESVAAVRDADPEALAEVDGIGPEQAIDIAAAAATIGEAEAEAEAANGSDSGDDGEGDAGDGRDGAGAESPEDTLQQAMSLLDAHDDRWRESDGEEPYEVDLPNGSTTGVRTKDDIKRLIFKHWR